MLLAFGLYGYHLILMISIFNTVEYNELKKGSRREGIITSIRPFITKLGCALVVVITSLCYLLFRVTDFTNQIAGFEQAANQNLITTEMKNAEIAKVIQNIGKGQSIGMLLFMVIVPFVLLLISYLLYIRHYKLDEDKYAEIISELENQKGGVC
jgi:melibiose permease/lactose/raffinose/galactose permease